MSSVTPVGGRKERTAAEVYDELAVKLLHRKSISVLIRAADSDAMQGQELSSVGYALESMVGDIQESVDGLYQLGGAS